MGFWPKLRSESGAAAVEMALLAPFLILVLLGAIDFGWLFAEHLDARHGAREAGRQAATNAGDSFFVVGTACSFMDNPVGTTVSISSISSNVGADVAVTIKRPANTMTGLLDWAVPDSLVLTARSTFRIETNPVTWTNVADQPCP